TTANGVQQPSIRLYSADLSSRSTAAAQDGPFAVAFKIGWNRAHRNPRPRRPGEGILGEAKRPANINSLTKARVARRRTVHVVPASHEIHEDRDFTLRERTRPAEPTLLKVSAAVRPLLGSLDRILEETAMNYVYDDSQAAYLFQCGNEELFAVCLDRSGAGLPRSSCAQGWILRQEFQLSVQKPVPAAIAPEPILRGIVLRAYYL